MVSNQERPYRDEQWLREKYSEEGRTQEEVADMCGVSGVTIWRWLDKFGVEGNRHTEPVEPRFWDRVERGGEGGCWEWTGDSVSADGYGKISVDGTEEPAHRVSYRMENGEIDDGLFVLHTCDNPPCVNPNHLYTGTAQDNANDAVERDRFASGEDNPKAFLSDCEVDEIRWRYDSGGVTQRELADEFDCSRSCVRDIVNGVNR